MTEINEARIEEIAENVQVPLSSKRSLSETNNNKKNKGKKTRVEIEYEDEDEVEKPKQEMLFNF